MRTNQITWSILTDKNIFASPNCVDKKIFNEKYYDSLPGGILESFGRLFKHDLSIYVSPALVEAKQQHLTLDNLVVGNNLTHLFEHLKQNRYLRPLTNINPDNLPILSHQVLDMIHNDDDDWVNYVPAQVAHLIKSRNLFRKNWIWIG